MNGVEMIRGKGASKAVPLLGIGGGIAQIIMGATQMTDGSSGNGVGANKEMLSYMNIGLGTASILMSSWNLLTNKHHVELKTSWNIYGVPTADNSPAIGLVFTRKF
jgi:hypothetical protein